MRSALIVLLCGLAAMIARGSTPAEPVRLVNGKDLAAFEFVAKPATALSSVCHVTADGALALAGKPIGYLATKTSYDNYRLHVEWRWPVHTPKNSNGGVLVHIATGPKDRAWPECFQVQLKPGRAADMLPMAGATFAEPLSTPADAKTPLLNHRQDGVEKPFGEWNSADILCRDGTIEVTVNGVLESNVTDATPGAGKVGFQFEGTPYELRNVVLTPLD